ncbi:hypothetical protein [Acinetobacter nosocomialis]|uniref:hypothetical protein n=1 Tax=Acinetobacter nosocomialis TaxID=106654 RepID=UPI0024DE9810|nr:hypothetical protein [Acinetobacter nosocomialis]
MANLSIDLADHYDAVCLAKAELDWVLYAFSEIKEKTKSLKSEAEKHNMPDAYFDSLEQFTSILEYTMMTRSNHWEDEEKRIAEQLHKNKELKNA